MLMASFSEQLAALQEQDDAAATAVLQRALALAQDPHGSTAAWAADAMQVWAALGRGAPEDIARAQEAGIDPGQHVTGHGRAGHVFPGPLRASAVPEVLAVEWLPCAQAGLQQHQEDPGQQKPHVSADESLYCASALSPPSVPSGMQEGGAAAQQGQAPQPTPPPGRSARPAQQRQQAASGRQGSERRRPAADAASGLPALSITGVALQPRPTGSKPVR